MGFWGYISYKFEDSLLLIWGGLVGAMFGIANITKQTNYWGFVKWALISLVITSILSYLLHKVNVKTFGKRED